MALEVRRVKDVDEFTGGIMAIGQYFGMVPTEERMQRFADLMTLERMHAAWADGRSSAEQGRSTSSSPFRVESCRPRASPSSACRRLTAAVVCCARSCARSSTRHTNGASHSPRCGPRRRRSTDGSATAWRPSAARSRSHTSTPRSRSRLEPQGTLRLIEPEEALEAIPPVFDEHQARVARDVLPQSNLVGAARDRRS